jgi:hypothetical protein
MGTVLTRRRDRRHTSSRSRSSSLASVYVDTAARSDAVRATIAALPVPHGVTSIEVDDRSMTGTFGCRIAVDLTGTFDQTSEGRVIARRYADALSTALGVPAFALYDLLRSDSTEFLC